MDSRTLDPVPTYYVTNPALQRAFDNFWANRTAADGVGLQDHYVAAARALAERLRGERYVLGYEAMNEPWPGTDFTACVFGCPNQEAQLLVPFYQRFATAIRAVSPDPFVFFEPFSLFNFGQSSSSLPAIGAPGNGSSPHVYGGSPERDRGAMDHAVADATRTGNALIVGEWGATNDPAEINRAAAQLDARFIPWIFWAYTERVILDPTKSPTSDNLRQPVVQALARPYPLTTNGTPLALAFDPATRTLTYQYSTIQPGGRQRSFLQTGIVVPPDVYPNGYRVEVSGAVVTSRPGAARLELWNLSKASTVSLKVTPASAP